MRPVEMELFEQSAHPKSLKPVMMETETIKMIASTPVSSPVVAMALSISGGASIYSKSVISANTMARWAVTICVLRPVSAITHARRLKTVYVTIEAIKASDLRVLMAVIALTVDLASLTRA